MTIPKEVGEELPPSLLKPYHIIHGIIYWATSARGRAQLCRFVPMRNLKRAGLQRLLRAQKVTPTKWNRKVVVRHTKYRPAYGPLFDDVCTFISELSVPEEPNWRRVTVLVAHDTSTTPRVAMSICNPTDTFERKRGIREALMRSILGSPIPNPHSIPVDLEQLLAEEYWGHG